MVSVPLNKTDPAGGSEGGVTDRDARTLFVLPADGIHLADVERSFVEQALEKAHGNQSKAARMLGISRFALRSRIERYHLRDKLKVKMATRTATRTETS